MLGQPTFPLILAVGLFTIFWVVVHLMEGLVVPDLNDTKCDLAHRNTTWNKRVAISKNNQQLKKTRPDM